MTCPVNQGRESVIEQWAACANAQTQICGQRGRPQGSQPSRSGSSAFPDAEMWSCGRVLPVLLRRQMGRASEVAQAGPRRAWRRWTVRAAVRSRTRSGTASAVHLSVAGLRTCQSVVGGLLCNGCFPGQWARR